MKIYNKEKTQILENPNLEKGSINIDKLFIKHHDIIPFTPEKSIESQIWEYKSQGKKVVEINNIKYLVLDNYSSGGMDIKEIKTIPAIAEVPAWDEYEDIYVYIPYTEQELKAIEYQNKINDLKQNLSSTDYQAIKYAEGQMTESEYSAIKSQRQAWRDEINQLEENIASNKGEV